MARGLDAFSLGWYAYFTALALAALVRCCLIALLVHDSEKRQKLCHTALKEEVTRLLAFTKGWTLTIDGSPRHLRGRQFLIVSNHQSLLDPLLLFILPYQLRFVAKEWVFALPVVGAVMNLAGHIRAQPYRAVNSGRRALESGASIVVFPEGSRSEDGNLQEFMKGAFKIAVLANVPILPIVIEGTREVLPKHEWKLRPVGEISMRVLEPVYPSEFEGNVERLKDYTKRVMTIELNQLRRPPKVLAHKRSA